MQTDRRVKGEARCKCKHECGARCKHRAKCECEHEARAQSEICLVGFLLLSICTGDISTKAMVDVDIVV